MQLADMTWPEIESAIERNCILTLPVGALEQHGPHLPVATDAYSILELAKTRAELDESIIAPAVFYSYVRPARMFPGTVSLRGETFMRMITEILREFIRQGFRQIVVLNGHWENAAFLNEAITELFEGDTGDAKVVLVNWWDLISEADVRRILGPAFSQQDGTHASGFETSMAMAIRPEGVRVDRITDDEPAVRLPYEVMPIPKNTYPESGVWSVTTNASAEKGQQIRAIVDEAFGKLIEREFATVKV